MTREQAKKQLINCGVAEPTEEQITNLLNSVKAEVDVEKNKAEKYKTDAEKLADVQAELDGLKQSGMSDVEKALADAKKAQEDAETLKNDYAKKSSQIEVEKIFVAAGLKTEDYQGFIDGIVGTDAEASKKLAQSFAETISKQRETAVAETKKELLKNTGNPDGDGGDGGETKTEDVVMAEAIASGMTAGGAASKSVFENY